MNFPSIVLRSFMKSIRAICQISSVFANGLGDRGSIPGRVIPKSQKKKKKKKKWYLMQPFSTLSNIRYVSRVKRSNPENRVVPSPTPRCGSY